MRVNISCDYCGRTDKCTMYMITLTSITDRSNSCTKVICDECAERLGMTLDEILDKRDIDDVLKEIEGDIIDGTET